MIHKTAISVAFVPRICNSPHTCVTDSDTPHFFLLTAHLRKRPGNPLLRPKLLKLAIQHRLVLPVILQDFLYIELSLLVGWDLIAMPDDRVLSGIIGSEHEP